MRKTILIIDDNATNRKLAGYVLASEYKVLEAGDAAEARAVLARTSTHAILMDIQMPGMDGLALTRLIKEDPAHQHIRIIALTSHAMKGDEEKARAAGCDGYITKPIDTHRFPIQVAAFLSAPKLADNKALS